MKSIVGYTIALSLLAILIASSANAIFNIYIPLDFEYKKQFGSNIKLIERQTTFQGVREQLEIYQGNIDRYFKEDHNTIYKSDPLFYWSITWDNSLDAQDEYIQTIFDRIDSYQRQYDSMVAGNNTAMLEDWYDKSLINLKSKWIDYPDRDNYITQLDYVSHDAWVLRVKPEAYWYPYQWLALFFTTVITMVGLSVVRYDD